VLRALALHGGNTRAELARHLGVTRSTIGAPSARLLDLGILRFAPDVESGGVGRFGRPGERLELAPDFCTFVSVDISIGVVRVILTDMQGALLKQAQVAMAPADQNAEATIDVVIRLIADVIDGRDDTAGIAVSVPGVVADTGMVVRAPIIGWRDVPLQAALSDRFAGIGPVRVFNDASLYAKTHLLTRIGPSDGNAVIVWMDAGMGGGLIVDGIPINGHTGLAGEIGHMIIGPQRGGRLQRLEDIAGSAALLARHAELGGVAQGIDGLRDAHRRGEDAAQQALDEWGQALAQGLATLTSILEPGLMVFSGPMAAVLHDREAETHEAYRQLLHYGTHAAHWRIHLSDDTTLALGGAMLLRHGFLSYDAARCQEPA